MSNKTKAVIAAMLKENTGTALCDSGGTPRYDADGKYVGSTGGYGRSFERNASRDFEAEQPCSVRFSKGHDGKLEIELYANLYHWLVDRLEYDEETDNLFRKFAGQPNNEDKSWHDLVEEFPYHLAELKGIDKSEVGGGPYGEGKPYSFYTYNFGGILSQDIIVSDFVIDGEPYLLLQIHNGCDARGGFTAPRIFKPFEPESLYNFANADIICKNGHGWYTDDAYHWYPENCIKEIGEYAVLDDEDIEGGSEEYQRYLREKQIYDEWKAGQQLMADFPEPKVVVGFIRVDEDHKAYCPICGGELFGWA
jgi:hypothetical protein